MEQNLAILSDGAALCGMLYTPPEGAVRGALLLCDPLFEERKAAQRTLVELARALAAAGVAVLRFDYRGCGDSPGDVADFGPGAWLADIRAAHACLRERLPAGTPVGLAGLRLGATLAAQAARELADAWLLLLLEPVTDGMDHLRQELRRKLMKEMLTFGGSRATRDGLVHQLEEGRSIDVDGYEITPRLYREMGSLRLADAVAGARAPLLLASITPSGATAPALRAVAEPLAAAGRPVTLQARRGQPFWSLVGHVDCTELIADTVAWVRLHAGAPRPLPPLPSPPGWGAAGPEGAEETVAFPVGGECVRGVLHRPPAGAGAGAARPAVLLCAGWSGGRVGPHRMFVKLARRLAAAGFWCLRHDYRGRGDSEGETAAATIRRMTEDSAAAAAFLGAASGAGEVVLVGICSGGKVAIGTAVAGGVRVCGLVLWSGEALGSLRSDATNRRKSAFALRTYLAKLTRLETWRKLLTGRVNVQAVNRAMFRPETRSAAEAREEEGVLDRFRRWRGQVLLVYGGNDPETALAGARYRAFCEERGWPLAYHEIAEANHSFYSLAWERDVLDLTLAWLQRTCPGVPADAPGAAVKREVPS